MKTKVLLLCAHSGRLVADLFSAMQPGVLLMTDALILQILLILSVGWLLGYVFSRFGLPGMLGQLVAGVLLGPPVLGLIQPSEPINFIADLGIFFVMFHSGMEMDPRELFEHLGPSLAVAFGGFFLPFGLGFMASMLFDGTVNQSLFMGLGVSITAIAVQMVILHSMRINQTRLGHIIIGAAIADDILALVVLSVLCGIAKTGRFEVVSTGFILVKVFLFFLLTFIAGYFILPRLTRKLHDREGRAFTFAMILALVLAYLAEEAGLHLIIGAFLAGQFLRRGIRDEKLFLSMLDRFFGLSYGFLIPVFLASLSFHLVFSWDMTFIGFALLIFLVAVVGKVVGSGLGLAVCGFSFWESTIVGFGMNGRGAVELVVATVVTTLSKQLMASGVIVSPLLTEAQFSALVLMGFVTTLITPMTLKWSVMRACRSDEKAPFCQLWEESHHPAETWPVHK